MHFMISTVKEILSYKSNYWNNTHNQSIFTIGQIGIDYYRLSISYIKYFWYLVKIVIVLTFT